MTAAAFDNEKYLQTQSEHIRQRIAQFGGKLYLEFGGKLYDDNHASRVLPGFQPDSKLRMLLQLKEQVEMVIAINADDIEKNKVRGDLGITYDRDVIRLIDVFRSFGLYVSSVVLTRFHDQPLALAFQSRLEGLGIRVYHHYGIPGYPANTSLIVSDEGFGKNDYIETSRSLVVVTGIIKDFTMSTGLITDIVVFFGGERQSLIQNPNLYRTIYIVSDIWQGIGWGSIIYLSALAGVSEDLYEAAAIDGAGRWKKLVNVTIPAIMPTIVTMLIMRLGQVLGSNYEKTILLYNEATYETADVISSYVYRVGLLDRDWGYSAAIGLFNSLINVILLLITNKISKKLTETSLW